MLFFDQFKGRLYLHKCFRPFIMNFCQITGISGQVMYLYLIVFCNSFGCSILQSADRVGWCVDQFCDLQINISTSVRPPPFQVTPHRASWHQTLFYKRTHPDHLSTPKPTLHTYHNLFISVPQPSTLQCTVQPNLVNCPMPIHLPYT